MTHMPDTSAVTPALALKTKGHEAVEKGFHLEEAFWGYRIVGEGTPPLRFIVMQATALIFGAGLMAASVTLALTSGAGDALFRLPVVLLLLAIGLIAMWFATRGTTVQVEVDTMNGELREVVRNRTGAQTVLSRYGFDCVGGVFIQRPAVGPAALVLRYRNTARTLPVATGRESDLTRLRDRMGRDLIISRDAA